MPAWFAAVASLGSSPLGAQEPESSLEAAAIAAAVEERVVAAIDRAAPAVVAITRVPKVNSMAAQRAFTFNLPTLENAVVDPSDPSYLPTHFGSGVILSADGDILTCYHVLDDPEEHDYYVWWQGQAAEAEVQRIPAKVQAGDPWTDLAVLKIEARDLPVMPLGNASKLKRGRFVISLGNPYAIARDGRPSASTGIVANLQRAARPNELKGKEPLEAFQTLAEFGSLIQTDAKLNLGTSGGALVDLEGRMVGLTTSLASVAGYETAAGYAIPIDPPMRKIIARLQEGRLPEFGFLGVEPIDVPGNRGARVARLVPGLPGERAGLQVGDVIEAVDEDTVPNANALFRELSRRPATSLVSLQVVRGNPSSGARLKVPVRLGKKQVRVAKPAYSRVPPPSWRGLQVDWSTALPPLQLLRSRRSRSAEVAVLRVDPDTPAWKAGLRPGQFVLSVNNHAVESPDDFYDFADAAGGTVTIAIIDNSGRPQQARVDPAPQAAEADEANDVDPSAR